MKSKAIAKELGKKLVHPYEGGKARATEYNMGYTDAVYDLAVSLGYKLSNTDPEFDLGEFAEAVVAELETHDVGVAYDVQYHVEKAVEKARWG